MTSLLALWSDVIPDVPLALPYGTLMSAVTIAVLVLCAVALWFERDRQKELPEPTHFRDEERLAA